MNFFLKNKFLFLAGFVCGLLSEYSLADTLITHEKTYRDVYIMEGVHSFYILLPETGTIESILKKDIIHDAVIFDDPEKRIALKKKWDEKQSVSRKSTEMGKGILKNPNNEDSLTEFSLKSTEFVLKRKGNASKSYQTGNVHHYSENSTYSLPGNAYPLNINSSQRRMNGKAYGFYNLQGTDNLPKLVLRNPPVSGGGYSSGLGMTNYSMNAFPGGGMGRMPLGYGYGMGMFNDVTVISNISDLFSTIDDRLVGEFGPLKIIPSTITYYNNHR